MVRSSIVVPCRRNTVGCTDASKGKRWGSTLRRAPQSSLIYLFHPIKKGEREFGGTNLNETLCASSAIAFPRPRFSSMVIYCSPSFFIFTFFFSDYQLL